MARNKEEYLRKLSRAGDRSATKNQEVLAEILIDLLDVMDDVLVKLNDIEEVLKNP